MQYLDYFLQVFAYFLPYAACVAAGGYLEYRYGAKVIAAAKADLAALKADLAALKAKL
jgi:cell division protein FtsB